MINQYDLIAEEYAKSLTITKKYIILPTFEKIIGKVKDKKVLDLACGSGFFTREIAKRNPSKIIGVDLSSKEIIIAKEQEKKESLGIEYICDNVLDLKLKDKFNTISAVYLLNYAKSEKELKKMCKIIFDLLEIGGKFVAITTHPNQKPNKEFKYDKKIYSKNQKDKFKNGDEIIVQLDKEGRIKFTCYFWTRDQYEKSLKEAGFKNIKWVQPIISTEGYNKFGMDYWKDYKLNPSTIGLICKK